MFKYFKLTKEERKAKKAEKKAQNLGFWHEFKAFVTKGNVVQLAIGIIIGASFKAIVDSLVADIIMPLIGLIVNVDIASASATLREATAGKDAIVFRYGMFIQAVVNFFIIALSIFIGIKIASRLSKTVKTAKAEIKEKAKRIKKSIAQQPTGADLIRDPEFRIQNEGSIDNNSAPNHQPPITNHQADAPQATSAKTTEELLAEIRDILKKPSA
ncbi:MAG: large conductance mechanosensitive channel protein MscL [Firmicutes bacterium]|nr:large conductance mechanosensitive channel protein MscL [Bacillota bacterium]